MALDFAAIRSTLDFFLDDWIGAGDLCARDFYAMHDASTFSGVLDLCERMAAEEFEPHNRLVDIEEPHFDGVRVTMPAATARACKAFAESGLLSAGLSAEQGGMQLPCVVEMAANSMFSAASIGIKAYSLLSIGNANLLMTHGTDRQKEVFAKPQFDGRWFGTMNLSEPDAGSSLSDIVTRATPDGADYEGDPLGPRYRVFGRKMWISGGEHDLSENIVHLVLAKIPDASGKLPAGAKGISLFIVPKIKVDADGRMTNERNDVALAGLNHKLGYRGTVNTLLNYGENGGAIGYRVGAAGAGLSCMFHMMNEARIGVGLGAAMLGLAGYLQSLDYARQRKQGRPMQGGAAGKDPNQPPVLLIEHPDIRRMLLAQKAYSEGAIALCLYCARLVDEYRSADEGAAREAAFDELEILTPIVKSWPSEWCVEANSLAIQIHGGYGYTRDFPVEQHWRDNRLNMIHEGTHGIQAIDLLGRKARMKGGKPFAAVLQKMRACSDAAAEDAAMADLGAALRESVDMIERATRAAWVDDNAPDALANATAYMRAFGHVAIAWMWLDVALAATKAGHIGARPQPFVAGKLAAARYFITHELPLAAVWVQPAARRDPLFASLSAEAF